MIAAALPILGFGLLVAACLLAACLLLGRTRDAQAVLEGGILALVRPCLWLRYRIRAGGLKQAVARGNKGVLFLPNHPALIEPIMLMAVLRRAFHPRPLADENQVNRFFIRWLARRMDALVIPDVAKTGAAGRDRIQAALDEIVASLKRGQNVLLYPSGRVYRSRLESVAGSSAVETVLREVPGVRVVLVRTRGLWGSSFSWAWGHEPNVAKALLKGLASLLASGIVFAPRREVSIELHEGTDLPRPPQAPPPEGSQRARSSQRPLTPPGERRDLSDLRDLPDAGAGTYRTALNRFLEDFYNQGAPYNTHVPYTIWQRGGVRRMPEPADRAAQRDPGRGARVPAATRKIVTDYLRGLTGASKLSDADELGRDLGLDSLAAADLVAWLEGEFGFPQAGVESLRTVGDVLLAACGEAPSAGPAVIKPIRPKWFASDPRNPLLTFPQGDTIPEVFLNQAARRPGRLIAADQTRGERSYRDIVTAIYVLRPIIASLPGRRVGIMLPASVGADVLYLAALLAGKTPVMVNWTVGPRNILHSLDVAECPRILTAELLVRRLAGQGVDLDPVAQRLVFLEQAVKGVSAAAKLKAAVKSRLSWSDLRDAQVPQEAAILFTSGSESLPKAVPLTHRNILTNLRDALSQFRVYANDCLVGILPPFHSFGLSTGLVLPLCLGVKVVHHPNPTEGRLVGRLIEAYGGTLLLGTPTFLDGIVRASTSEQLRTLRLGVTAAEKCATRVYQALASACPNMVIIEGYGVTECSPIVSANDENAPRPGTIGKPLPSLEHAVVDVDTGQAVPPGRQGMLLLRGPTVFGGYLGGPDVAASPFVEFQGKTWYRTGDLVSQDADGVLTFRGRLKRFVKLGGEMISLPAIEAVLEAAFREGGGEEGPVLAVQATAEEDHPELVLFTTIDVDREAVNRLIREGGLSGLHNIRRVIRLDEIPVLGTGKTDYRALAAMLEP